ncbi:6GAL, partial [Symbiodinium sp. KB8]
EGCKVDVAQQARVIARLRDELDQRGLGDVVIAASDENRPDHALRTWQELGRAEVAGGPSGSYVGCLNVHAYDGLEPWL